MLLGFDSLAGAQVTRLASTGNAGVGDGSSNVGSLSADGRFVVFSSLSQNLVSHDDNFFSDVFLRDRATGAIRRVSVDSAGNEANGPSFHGVISADGSAVVFISGASNLVAGDGNGVDDVFVKDLETGAVTRVHVDSSGLESDGPAYNLFWPDISADGSIVAFTSAATNLVPGDTNGFLDAFVHDLESSQTERVSVNSSGGQGNGDSIRPFLGGDGNRVVFESIATNLDPVDSFLNSDVYLRDRSAGTTQIVSVNPAGAPGTGSDGFFNSSFNARISADGNCVAFASYAFDLVPGDTNFRADVFLRDLSAGTTRRVSVATGGGQASDDSSFPSLSADGSKVAFSSFASDLVSGDTNQVRDVFVHDVATGETRRASVGTAGAEGEAESAIGNIAQNGQQLVFQTLSNLVQRDDNQVTDMYVNGPELWLESDRTSAQVGDEVKFLTFGGGRGLPAVLVVTAVASAPMFVLLPVLGTFDQDGAYEVSGTVTSSPGVDVTFQTLAFSAFGGITASQEVTLAMQ
jgi:Tol biopolymer transport system component